MSAANGYAAIALELHGLGAVEGRRQGVIIYPRGTATNKKYRGLKQYFL